MLSLILGLHLRVCKSKSEAGKVLGLKEMDRNESTAGRYRQGNLFSGLCFETR